MILNGFFLFWRLPVSCLWLLLCPGFFCGLARSQCSFGSRPASSCLLLLAFLAPHLSFFRWRFSVPFLFLTFACLLSLIVVLSSFFLWPSPFALLFWVFFCMWLASLGVYVVFFCFVVLPECVWVFLDYQPVCYFWLLPLAGVEFNTYKCLPLLVLSTWMVHPRCLSDILLSKFFSWLGCLAHGFLSQFQVGPVLHLLKPRARQDCSSLLSLRHLTSVLKSFTQLCQPKTIKLRLLLGWLFFYSSDLLLALTVDV